MAWGLAFQQLGAQLGAVPRADEAALHGGFSGVPGQQLLQLGQFAVVGLGLSGLACGQCR